MGALRFAPVVRGAATEQSDDDFDYVCSVARAQAIDAILLDAVEARGWDLFDDRVLARVSVQHEGDTRVRILVDGRAVTPWWDDRLTVEEGRSVWRYELAPE